jgi:predicted O-methyltransferase YrrM
LLDRLSEAAALPGDVVECGVWRGGTALLLAASLEALAPSKRLYLCDSFQGLPALTDGDRPEWYREGRFAARRDEVAELLARHHLADRCTILEGWFADTLPSLSGIRACMVHIDCDLYQSTVDCLTHLYPAVADGGVIVFDDYSDGSGGERKAANAHAAATGEVLHIGPYSQAYLYKGETIANTRARELLEAPSEDHRVLRSLSSLQDNAAYGEHVTNVLDRLREITRDFATFERLCRGSAASSPRPGAD